MIFIIVSFHLFNVSGVLYHIMTILLRAILKTILCSILILLTVSACAGPMRCPGGTVSTGDLAVSVVPKCKSPNTVIKGGDTERKGRYTADTNKIMDEWIYDFRPSGSMYKLTMINGVVSDIENLGLNSGKRE